MMKRLSSGVSHEPAGTGDGIAAKIRLHGSLEWSENTSADSATVFAA
jgi:hypothetical protein